MALRKKMTFFNLIQAILTLLEALTSINTVVPKQANKLDSSINITSKEEKKPVRINNSFSCIFHYYCVFFCAGFSRDFFFFNKSRVELFDAHSTLCLQSVKQFLHNSNTYLQYFTENPAWFREIIINIILNNIS